MARPMFYPMGTLEVGESATMPAVKKGDAKRTSRNASQYGQRHNDCNLILVHWSIL